MLKLTNLKLKKYGILEDTFSQTEDNMDLEFDTKLRVSLRTAGLVVLRIQAKVWTETRCESNRPSQILLFLCSAVHVICSVIALLSLLFCHNLYFLATQPALRRQLYSK